MADQIPYEDPFQLETLDTPADKAKDTPKTKAQKFHDPLIGYDIKFFSDRGGELNIKGKIEGSDVESVCSAHNGDLPGSNRKGYFKSQEDAQKWIDSIPEGSITGDVYFTIIQLSSTEMANQKKTGHPVKPEKEPVKNTPATMTWEEGTLEGVVRTGRNGEVFQGGGRYFAIISDSKNNPDGTETVTMVEGDELVISPDGRGSANISIDTRLGEEFQAKIKRKKGWKSRIEDAFKS
jgi:hypothetical protein